MGMINSDNLIVNSHKDCNLYNNSKKIKSLSPLEQNEAVINLVNYLEGRPVSNVDSDTFSSELKSSISALAIFDAPRGISWLKKAKGIKVDSALNIASSANAADNAVSCAAKLGEYAKPVKTALNDVFTGSGQFTPRINNYLDSVAEFKENSGKLTSAMSAFKEANSPGIFSRVKKAVGNIIKPSVASAQTTAETAQQAVHAAEKAGSAKKAGGRLFNTSTAKVMVAINGAIELFKEIIPTYKELGFKAGVKQTAKSAVNVLSYAGGWVAGEKGGEALGAAIGTAICPGIGTAVGAAIGGFIGGSVGSWATGKLAKGITGKSEREIARDKQTNAQAQIIQSNPQDLEALKELVINKINNSASQNGYIDADSKKALEELEKLNNPFASQPLYV